jgi:hypothetical protein
MIMSSASTPLQHQCIVLSIYINFMLKIVLVFYRICYSKHFDIQEFKNNPPKI